MPVAQEIRRLHFGSAKLFGAVNGTGGASVFFDELQEVDINWSTELKEAYSDGNFAFAVADGHRSIDITGKHYLIDVGSLATELGGSNPVANTNAWAIDEKGVVPATPFKLTLVNSATAKQPWKILVGVTTNGITNPVPYTVVASGSEVAGVSCSYAAGVLTFSAADTGLTVITSYAYALGSSAGLTTAVTQAYQNSGPTMSLTAVRRDRSRVDSGTALFAYEFKAVRSAGIKSSYKEGDYTVYERSFKAYADPMGNVCNITQVNV